MTMTCPRDSSWAHLRRRLSRQRLTRRVLPLYLSHERNRPFAAIADQNGRILLEALRRGPKTVSQLAARIRRYHLRHSTHLPARLGAGSRVAIVQEHIRQAGIDAGTRAA